MPGPHDPELTHDANQDDREAALAAFDRPELQALVERAEAMAQLTPNPRWRRAYENLAQAASVLDAFQARCTIRVENPISA